MLVSISLIMTVILLVVLWTGKAENIVIPKKPILVTIGLISLFAIGMNTKAGQSVTDNLFGQTKSSQINQVKTDDVGSSLINELDNVDSRARLEQLSHNADVGDKKYTKYKVLFYGNPNEKDMKQLEKIINKIAKQSELPPSIQIDSVQKYNIIVTIGYR